MAETTKAAAAESAADEALVRGYRKARRGYVDQRQDGQDHRRRGRRPREAPPVRQGHPPHLQGEGARRGNTAGIGDLVLISETRPLSATKRWRLVEILEKAK